MTKLQGKSAVLFLMWYVKTFTAGLPQINPITQRIRTNLIDWGNLSLTKYSAVSSRQIHGHPNLDQSPWQRLFCCGQDKSSQIIVRRRRRRGKKTATTKQKEFSSFSRLFLTIRNGVAWMDTIVSVLIYCGSGDGIDLHVPQTSCCACSAGKKVLAEKVLGN